MATSAAIIDKRKGGKTYRVWCDGYPDVTGQWLYGVVKRGTDISRAAARVKGARITDTDSLVRDHGWYPEDVEAYDPWDENWIYVISNKYIEVFREGGEPIVKVSYDNPGNLAPKGNPFKLKRPGYGW